MTNILFNGEFHLTNATTLEEYYDLIGCSTIEFAYITDTLGVYVDEEGLFNDEPFFRLLYVDNNYNIIRAIAGNILFVNHNEEGETIALTAQQVEEILNLTVEDGRIIIKGGF